MNDIIVTAEQVFSVVPKFAILLIGMIIGKIVWDMTTSYSLDHELTENDNPALGIMFGGYLLGLGISLCGVLFGTGMNFIEIGIMTAVCLILMRVSITVVDKFVLSSYHVDDEILNDRNNGVGFTVAGTSVGTGIILFGVFMGESTSFLTGIRDIVLYWAIGQIMFIVSSWLYQKITSYDIHKVMRDDDNVAAGIGFCGFLISTGMMTCCSFIGATSNITQEILPSLTIYVLGILTVMAGRPIVDKFLLPKSPLSKEIAVDRNTAAGAVEACSYIAISLMFAASYLMAHPELFHVTT